MPNGDDTVTVQKSDGSIVKIPKSSLSIARSMGAKVYDPNAPKPKPSTLGQVATGFGESYGYDPKNPVSGTLKNLAAPVLHPIQTGKYLVGEAEKQTPEGVGRAAIASLPYLAGGDWRHAAEEFAGKITPLVGGGLETMARGDTARGIGQLAGSATQLALAARAPKPSLKTGVRELVGVSDKDIQPIIEKSQKAVTDAEQEREQKISDLEESHAKKLEAIRQKTADKIAETQKKTVEASRAQTAAETKQAALATKQGPVYQRLTGMADKAQDNIREVDNKVRVLEGARWNAFRRSLGDVQVDWRPWQDAVAEAQEKTLSGVPENITIFKQILQETGDDILSQASVFKNAGRGIQIPKEAVRSGRFAEDDVQSAIRQMKERASQIAPTYKGGERVEPQMPEAPSVSPESSVPLDTARAYYTKLGQKIASIDMPNQVRRALRQVQDAGDNEIMRAVGKAGGKSAVMEYRQLKSNWRDYMETFYDKDSPVRKLKEGADPNDKLNPIVGDEGARAISLLGKYRDLGADVQSLGRIRALQKSLKELKSTGGKMPSAVEKPSLPAKTEPPEPVSAKPIDAESARRIKVQQASQSYAHPPSRWELMFPPLLGYRMALKKLLQNPKIQEWLAKEARAAPGP